MMMTQRTVSDFLQLLAFQELYVTDPGGRPQMVHYRVSFIETLSGHDMLVSNAFILIARSLTITAKPDVMFSRHFAEFLVIWHSRILLPLCCHSERSKESLIIRFS
jgi:hypothetical protein